MAKEQKAQRVCGCTHGATGHAEKKTKKSTWKAECTASGCTCKRYKWAKASKTEPVKVEPEVKESAIS